jgi:uncharacterized protein YjbJ (UPF0337 family)
MNIGPIELTNTVSGVVLSILLIVVGGLAWLLKGIYQIRFEATKASDKATEAADNTRSVSNGFAGKVNGKLDELVDLSKQNNKAIDDVQSQLSDHLRWHLEKENQNG